VIAACDRGGQKAELRSLQSGLRDLKPSRPRPTLLPVMESRDLVSVSTPVFWDLGLGLEGLRSRLGLKGFRSWSRVLRLETLPRLFFMKFCKKEFL